MVESHRQEIAKLEALYASNPAGRVFVHLAEALRRAGEHERSRSILEEGLARHPDSASGYVVLGRVLIDRGENTAAESAFRRALELDDGNLVALRWLGDLARGAGRPGEALDYYRELVARNPASASDGGLMRLVEETRQSAAEAARRAEAAAEEAEAAAEQEAEAAAAPEPAESVAAGRAGPAEPAEPEYGMVELEALPGDLASFAGLAAPERAAAGAEPEAETGALEDDVVVLLESSAAPLELEELETELAAAPAEVHLLSALPEPETEPTEGGFTLPEWSAATQDLAVPFAEEVDAAAPAGDMDVAAAMLDVGELATATPFEVVPAATELTLVDDESVRVAMDRAEEAAGGAEVEPAAPGPAEPVAIEEPVAAAEADADADARTQYPVEAGEAAAADEEYADLPWLVEPTEAAGTELAPTGAGEDIPAPAEPFATAAYEAAEAAVEDAPETAAPAETGPAAEHLIAEEVFAAAPAAEPAAADADLESGAAGDGALDVPAPSIDAAAHLAEATTATGEEYDVPFDVVEDVPIPGDYAADFEAPAEPVVAESAGESTPALAEPFEGAEIAAYAEPLDELLAAETAPDSPRSELEPPAEADSAAAAFAVLEEPADATGEEIAAAPTGEPPPSRFAEDVEAEPDLATFMENVEAGYVLPELAFPGYEPDEANLIDIGQEAAQPVAGAYLEDVEAEPDLAEFATEAAAEPDRAAEPERSEVAWTVEPEPALPTREERIAADRDWLDELEAELSAAEAEPASAGLRDFPVEESEPAAIAGAALEDLPVAGAEEEAVPSGGPAEAAELAATGGPEPAYGARVPVAGTAGVESDLGTETLADLYLAQGFAQRAAEVYRALLRQRPDEERLASKLRDAEAALAGSHAADTDDAGDVWLRGVESAWTGGAGATGQEPTPYAWTEREEREQGLGIGAYLRELISWGTGEAARLEPAAAGAAESEPEAEPEPPSGRAEATSGVEGQTEEGSEPAGPAAWEMMTEPVLDESWDAPETAETWSPPAEEPPPDPWLAPEPAAVRGAPSETAPRAASANPVEEAFNEWFGPPADTGGAPAADTQKPQSGRERGPGEAEATADDDQDEDLEMFRAWLQSLKK